MLCIISSGAENLLLVKLCQQHTMSYEIITDTLARPYDDKDHSYLLQRVKKLIQTHQQAVGHNNYKYIVSPCIELGLSLEDNDLYQASIFPLFSSYLDYCFSHSASGRLGCIGGGSDIQVIENYITQTSITYQLSDYQAKTKKFLFPFALWTKDVSMRNYFLRLLSPRQMLINKIIKHDLRYFKDANVDTLIPLQYSYFRFQRTITGFLNTKKQKFHRQEIVSECFAKIKEKCRFSTPEEQSVSVYHTGTLHLIQDKKREHLISGGGTYTIVYKSIANQEL